MGVGEETVRLPSNETVLQRDICEVVRSYTAELLPQGSGFAVSVSTLNNAVTILLCCQPTGATRRFLIDVSERAGGFRRVARAAVEAWVIEAVRDLQL